MDVREKELPADALQRMEEELRQTRQSNDAKDEEIKLLREENERLKRSNEHLRKLLPSTKIVTNWPPMKRCEESSTRLGSAVRHLTEIEKGWFRIRIILSRLYTTTTLSLLLAHQLSVKKEGIYSVFCLSYSYFCRCFQNALHPG
jgi:regulator of replication initiation timing